MGESGLDNIHLLGSIYSESVVLNIIKVPVRGHKYIISAGSKSLVYVAVDVSFLSYELSLENIVSKNPNSSICFESSGGSSDYFASLRIHPRIVEINAKIGVNINSPSDIKSKMRSKPSIVKDS